MDNQNTSFSRTFNFILKINGKEYSNEVQNIRIVSNLQNCWPVFSINLFIPVSDILLENLHGQDDVELQMRSLAFDGTSLEDINFKLMILVNPSSAELSVEGQMIGDKQTDRTNLTLILVVKDAYKTMTKMVNGIYSNKKIKEVVTDLVNKAGNTKLVYDSNGENTDPINQVCVYPVTLYKALLYLDKNFGSHNGCPAIYCRYNNELHVINLSDRIKKAAKIIITHLSNSKDNTDDIKKSNDSINFYTYTKIKHENKINQEFSKLGKNITYIVKPSNKLFHAIKINLEDLCKEVGANFGNDKVFMNKSMDRDKYCCEDNGNDTSETFIKSSLAKKIFGLNSISLEMEKIFTIEKFLNVGEVVKFKTSTVEYIDLSGQYILQMSDITWNRNGKEWENTIKLKLVRTNKSK
jgi:hypothetical protein